MLKRISFGGVLITLRPYMPLEPRYLQCTALRGRDSKKEGLGQRSHLLVVSVVPLKKRIVVERMKPNRKLPPFIGCGRGNCCQPLRGGDERGCRGHGGLAGGERGFPGGGGLVSGERGEDDLKAERKSDQSNRHQWHENSSGWDAQLLSCGSRHAFTQRRGWFLRQSSRGLTSRGKGNVSLGANRRLQTRCGKWLKYKRIFVC